MYAFFIKLSGYQQSIYYKSQRTLVGLLVEGVARSCINSANADIENQRNKKGGKMKCMKRSEGRTRAAAG